MKQTIHALQGSHGADSVWLLGTMIKTAQRRLSLRPAPIVTVRDETAVRNIGVNGRLGRTSCVPLTETNNLSVRHQ
jgi:hypothetical protein